MEAFDDVKVYEKVISGEVKYCELAFDVQNSNVLSPNGQPSNATYTDERCYLGPLPDFGNISDYNEYAESKCHVYIHL